MIEAFERHLTNVDITNKFEKAKTRDEKIKICREYLEKNGFQVSVKQKKVEGDFPKFPVSPSNVKDPQILKYAHRESDYYHMNGTFDPHEHESRIYQLAANGLLQQLAPFMKLEIVQDRSGFEKVYTVGIGVFKI